MISPESISSVTYHKEISHAATNKKRLIPVFYRYVPDKQIPEVLAGINFIYFGDADDFESKLTSLIDALDTDLDWKRTHTRLLGRAREWETKNRDASTIETNSLAAALRTLGQELASGRADHNCPAVNVQVEDAPQDLHPILRDDVYRIASEALRNASVLSNDP